MGKNFIVPLFVSRFEALRKRNAYIASAASNSILISAGLLKGIR